MSYISKIDPETAGEKEKEVIRNHLAQGYRLTNEKLTLLHNAEAFKAIEDSSYSLDRELQRLIGKRAGDFFEYAISEENDCLVCSTYFRKLLKDNGIDKVNTGNRIFLFPVRQFSIYKEGRITYFFWPRSCKRSEKHSGSNLY